MRASVSITLIEPPSLFRLKLDPQTRVLEVKTNKQVIVNLQALFKALSEAPQMQDLVSIHTFKQYALRPDGARFIFIGQPLRVLSGVPTVTACYRALARPAPPFGNVFA